MSHLTAARAVIPICLLVLTLVIGCATQLPPSMALSGEAPRLPGPVFALAGSGEQVLVANPDGVYSWSSDGDLTLMEIPGLQDPSGITVIALSADEIAIGTRNEGLYLFADGVWETRNNKYGGLPDNEVTAVAFEGDKEGLPGKALWIATNEGLTVRRNGEWADYKPGSSWLASMAGIENGSDGGNIYVGDRFKIGKRGTDKDLFKPPVTTITFMDGLVVLGKGDKRMAMLIDGSVALFSFADGYKVTSMLADEGTLWLGTNGGLWWGRHLDAAKGRPWPTIRGKVQWMASLLGNRDTRPFSFKWYGVGYNTAPVDHIAGSTRDLWSNFSDSDRIGAPSPPDNVHTGQRNENEKPFTGVRRYQSMEEYIARRSKHSFENYGLNSGVKGDVTALYVDPERKVAWIGTTKGLYVFTR